MSKSDTNENATVSVIDAPDAIMRKFKRAVTDSDNRIVYDVQNKPGISNLLTIYSAMTGNSIEKCEEECLGLGYGDFKLRVGESVVETLRPIREKYEDLLKNKDYLTAITKEGAEKASYLARKTLSKVYRKVGFVPKG